MRRLIALVVSLLLLLPAGTVSAQAFFCHMRGQVTNKCCCGDRAEEHDDRGPSPAASQGDCCDSRTLAADAERRSVSALDDLPDVPPAAVLAVLPLVLSGELRAHRVERAPPRARAPPPAKPAPLFILHRAFLS
ncbi:MAG: hypothetical protein IPM35_24715 [Myxococcales bacterium]|nr:hypothetical protein [Myxococcales bacterium]